MRKTVEETEKMWIAKPVHRLSTSEQTAWNQLETQLPLAQTLAWAKATETLAGRTFLVFSPNERTGGIVFTVSAPNSAQVHFECINGPHLHWDDPTQAPRQLATFAMAVSQLDPCFKSLRIKPRWEHTQTTLRLYSLPVQPIEKSCAATIIIPILPTVEKQFRALSPRLQRTLKMTWQKETQISWQKANSETLRSFVPTMKLFAKNRGFTVPPLAWFEIFSTSLSFIGTAQISEGNEMGTAQILVSFLGDRAFYLFGHELRSPGLRSALSPAAALHWTALEKCRQENIQTYDLNGYLIDAEPKHPYYGVSKFKEQFLGKIVQYDVPEFLIE